MLSKETNRYTQLGDILMKTGKSFKSNDMKVAKYILKSHFKTWEV